MSSPAKSRRTPVLAVLLALLLVLTACSSTDDPGKASTDEPSSSGGEAASITTDQLIALLAGAGIATYDDAAATTPVRAVESQGSSRLLRWQAETMTRQLNAKRGYRGTDLDALHPGDGGRRALRSYTGPDAAIVVPPISVVLAAYVKAGKTPGAEASRTLMGDQDFTHHATEIVYPDAVLAFFVNDLAGTRPTATAGPAAYVMPAMAPAAGGACTQLQDFLAGTLDSIVEALKINATSGVGGVLATIWNTVIEIAASAAQVTLTALTGPVVGLIKKAAGVLAVLSSASSLLDPWTVTTTADPDPVHFGLEKPSEVTVTSTVDSAIDFTWPADVKDCASAAGVELPDPGSAQGSPVTWKVQAAPEVATAGERDTVVDADGQARLHLTTGTETEADHDKGDLISSPVAVSTDLKRTQIDKLLDLVQSLLIGGLPGPVKEIVGDLLGPLKSSTRAKLTELLSVQGPVTWITVNHHGPAPEETPSTPSPSASDCPATGTATIPDGTWEGLITMDVDGKSSGGGFANSKGTGTLRVVVEKGTVKNGTWSLHWKSRGHADTGQAAATVTVDGNVTGKVKGPAAKPVVVGAWSISGRAEITKPIQQTVPIDESGQDTETMTVETTSCDDVTGTFVPSFNSKDTQASFTGTARWVGSRVG